MIEKDIHRKGARRTKGAEDKEFTEKMEFKE